MKKKYKITAEDIVNMKNDLRLILGAMMQDKNMERAILTWNDG